jgi:hypothetical protein
LHAVQLTTLSKGRVERAIQYIRDSFFAARPFTTLADFNRQARQWCESVAHQRPCPGDDSRTVAQVFAEEKPHLLSLPVHPFPCDLMQIVKADKTLYVRFDLNDYSVPPQALGRPLTLLASPSAVRLLDGATEVAAHRRSYDRHRTCRSSRTPSGTARTKTQGSGLYAQRTLGGAGSGERGIPPGSFPAR